MHSSDETGDERKGLANTGGAAEAETAKLPAHAFRERIRRASVAAAQASAPPAAALLPPEQSGVHDRNSDAPPAAAATKAPQSSAPDETSGTISKVVGGAADAAAPKHSSNAWPFAGGPAGPDDRRQSLGQTNLGIGKPQRSAAGNPRAQSTGIGTDSADSEVSDARRRMDTRDTKRSGAAVTARAQTTPARASKSTPPPPPSTKSTPPRPFRARDSKWSPTSTKPQRASLLRANTPKEPEQRSFAKTLREGPRAKAGAATSQNAERKPQELGSYTLSALADEYLEVSVDAHGLSISATDSSDDQPAQDAEIVDTNAAAQTEAASGGEPNGARARRYTPKQRGRSRERSDERAEYAPTIPDLRPTFTPVNKTVRGAGPQPQTSFPESGGLRINNLSPLDPSTRLTHPGGHPVTPDTPTQPRGKPVPRLPLVASPQMFTTKPAFAHPAAFSGMDKVRQPQVPGTLPPPRSPFAPASTQRGASANYGQQHEASIVVDPSLNAQVTEVRAPQRTNARPIQQPYQPLPSDPAAFEQMMRDQAAARGARLNWKQQATLVIPREELEAPTEQRLITPKMIASFIGATIVGALIMLAIGRYGDAGTQGKTIATTTSAAANGNSVVIATEPSGAELLLNGAVVGNTPFEVPRPPRGQAELTYVLRMRGFTQELIRLSAESQPAIRVTLTPDSGGVQ